MSCFDVSPALSRVCVYVFAGVNLEMLGRRALWEVGLNYGHGTGHGVGNYFGVHECMYNLDLFFFNKSYNRW